MKKMIVLAVALSLGSSAFAAPQRAVSPRPPVTIVCPPGQFTDAPATITLSLESLLAALYRFHWWR